jgi:hypothetical protein
MRKSSSINSFLMLFCSCINSVRSNPYMRVIRCIVFSMVITIVLSPYLSVVYSIDEVVVPEVSLNTSLTETLQTDSIIPAEGVRKEKSDPILGKSSKWLLIACTITVAVIVVLWGSSDPTNTNIDHYRDEHVFNLII